MDGVKNPPAYKESLIAMDMSEGAQREQRRCKGKENSRCCLVLCVALLFMAAMFVGGWFGGRHYQRHRDYKEYGLNDQYYQQEPQTYYQLGQGSDTIVRPELVGVIPVTDFVQCNYADGTECQSGNPMLTPKGTIQLTLYTFNGQSSFIITSTGEDYGEMPEIAARKRRAVPNIYNNKLHLTNCEGNVLTLVKDAYHQFDNVTHFLPGSGLHVPFNYSSTTSHTHVINLLGKMPKNGCNVTFDTAPSTHGFSVRGGDDITTSDSENIPVVPGSFNINNIKSLIPNFEPGPVDLSQFDAKKFTAAFPGSSDMYMASANSGSRKKRSFLSDIAKDVGTVYQLVHPITKVIESTIKVIHDIKHGGSNGTITYDITNHTAQCRSRFSMLYHDALHDVTGLIANASHHQTFMFRHQNAAGITNLSMWQSITPFVDQAASSAYSLVGQIPGVLPCFTGELNELETRMKSFLQKSGITRSKRFLGLSWKCGLVSSLEQGWDCGHSAFSCGSDIGEGDVTFGLSLFKAAKDCYGAGKNCYHLVHNCVGGL